MVDLPKVTSEDMMKSGLILDIFKIEAKMFGHGLSSRYGMCNRKRGVKDDSKLGVDQIISTISPQHNLL